MKRPILVLLAGSLLSLGLGAGAPAHAASVDTLAGSAPAAAPVNPAHHDHDRDWYHHRSRDHDWRDHDGDDDDYHDRYRDRDDSHHHGRQHCGGGLVVICLL